MIDIDIIVASRSAFNHLPSDFGDPDPADLDRLAASLDHLTVCCREPATEMAGLHPAAEVVTQYRQFLVGVMPTAGEQL